MSDITIAPRGSVNLKRHREPIAAQNSIRVYNHSPGYVALQLRRERDYSTVILKFEEVERLAIALGVAVSDQ